MKRLLAKRTLLLFLSIPLLHSCSRNPVTGKKELIFMSSEQEVAMGAQSHPSVVATMGLYEDQKLQRFIEDKGQSMAKISHRPELKYHFYIVDSPVVNAFAVPGGYVYFTRGIMAHFNNEAEFAGVLGHEIGHITARHSARQQTSQVLGQAGVMAGMILSPQVRAMGESAMQGVQMLLLSYSRAHESESDKIGVEYSSKIGYDANQMADFFGTLKRLGEKAGQSIPTFMSTHPDPGDRYTKVHQMAKEYQAKTPANYAVNRDSYLRMIDGIVYGEDPAQGFVESDQFFHPGLRFQFPVPRGWKYENSPIQFQMAPADGKSMMVFTMAEGKTLQEAAQNTAKQLNLQVLETGNTTINGNQATVLISKQLPEQTQGQTTAQDPNTTIQIASWLIQYNGTIYAIHGLTYAPNFAATLPGFKSVAQGFRALTDQEKINRKPERIFVKQVSRAGTFQQVMQDMKMPSNRVEELGILNALKAGDQVAKGTLLKTIGR